MFEGAGTGRSQMSKKIVIDGNDLVSVILGILIVIIMLIVIFGQPECSEGEGGVESCPTYESAKPKHSPR